MMQCLHVERVLQIRCTTTPRMWGGNAHSVEIFTLNKLLEDCVNREQLEWAGTRAVMLNALNDLKSAGVIDLTKSTILLDEMLDKIYG